MILKLCLHAPYRVAGLSGVFVSEQGSSLPHSYSAQEPAATTRLPPLEANASNKSKLACTQRKFSVEVQYFPGTAYHARCNRCVGSTVDTTSKTCSRCKRSTRCHVTSLSSTDRASFEETACIS